jgi:hypothetical protein
MMTSTPVSLLFVVVVLRLAGFHWLYGISSVGQNMARAPLPEITRAVSRVYTLFLFCDRRTLVIFLSFL